MRLKIMPQSARDESPGIRFLRIMLLICVFVGVGWLYSKHYDNALDEIQSRSAVLDKTGMLAKQQTQQLREFSKLFRDELGVELVIRVAEGVPETPKLKAKSMYFGVDVTGQRLISVFPPWLDNTLGPNFSEELQQHMKPYFESDSWPTGLLKALQMVWERMTGLSGGTN